MSEDICLRNRAQNLSHFPTFRSEVDLNLLDVDYLRETHHKFLCE